MQPNANIIGMENQAILKALCSVLNVKTSRMKIMKEIIGIGTLTQIPCMTQQRTILYGLLYECGAKVELKRTADQ